MFLMNDKKSNVTETDPKAQADPVFARLKFRPVRDSLSFLFAGLVIFAVLLSVFLVKPKSADKVHAEIFYKQIQLFDKEDPTKNKNISFPSSGEKKVVFTKEDSPLFLPTGETFAFVGDSVTFTLYADRSIQIMEEEIKCPNHDCSKQGRIYALMTPIVCLPNQVRAMIVSDGGTPSEWDA